jgi:hypothetical protein
MMTHVTLRQVVELVERVWSPQPAGQAGAIPPPLAWPPPEGLALPWPPPQLGPGQVFNCHL